MHENLSDERFRRFVDVQLFWDEHMARVAADYLKANPTRTMVVLAGSGHLAFEDAIPSRLARIAPGDYSVIVTGSGEGFVGDAVDYVLAERDIGLAPPGRFGMMLAIDDAGVAIRAIASGSPAAATDLRPGDRVVNIAGERIGGLDDVRLAVLDRAPGEQVWIEIERGGMTQSASRQVRVLTLL
jgi:membrane-associated protease RseP (regulator of RpoE activity)